MKKLLFLVLLAITVSFISCKKETERESKFTLNNIDHPLDHGYIVKAGASSTQSAYYLYLCSPEMELSSEGIAGYGDIIFYYLVSDDPEALISGEYVAGTNIGMAVTLIGFDEDLSESIEYSVNSSGTISADIVVSGDIYEIEFIMDLATGKRVEGYYKGTLEELVISSKKSLPLLSDN